MRFLLSVRFDLTCSLLNNREFQKLRRLLQRNCHNKLKLCVRLNVLQLFHVGHVVENRRSVLPLAWHELFSCRGTERKIYCCELALSSEPQIRNFMSSSGKPRQKITVHSRYSGHPRDRDLVSVIGRVRNSGSLFHKSVRNLISPGI